MLRIFHSDRFVPTLPPGHRFPIAKYGLVREQLQYEGTVQPSQLVEAPPCQEAAILAVHTAAYWEQIKQLRLSSRAARRIGFPQSSQLVERSRRSVQGTLLAAEWALQHGIGINLAGGTHHAFADHGEGFCLLNDLAITARQLLATGAVRRLLILDLDVHQGNGTARIFQNEPRVFTCSMHGAANYPLHKEQSDLDLALESGSGDSQYLRLLERTLSKLLHQFTPDLVLYQAGVDVLASDRLGHLSLTRNGCKRRDQLVIQSLTRKHIPLAICLGGGYSARLADTVEAHANTCRVAVQAMET